jgi:hypothetical protein
MHLLHPTGHCTLLPRLVDRLEWSNYKIDTDLALILPRTEVNRQFKLCGAMNSCLSVLSGFFLHVHYETLRTTVEYAVTVPASWVHIATSVVVRPSYCCSHPIIDLTCTVVLKSPQ